jgi:hypothetical protein
MLGWPTPKRLVWSEARLGGLIGSRGSRMPRENRCDQLYSSERIGRKRKTGLVGGAMRKEPGRPAPFYSSVSSSSSNSSGSPSRRICPLA